MCYGFTAQGVKVTLSELLSASGPQWLLQNALTDMCRVHFSKTKKAHLAMTTKTAIAKIEENDTKVAQKLDANDRVIEQKTGLAIFMPTEFDALDADEEMQAALAANGEAEGNISASDLVRIKTPSGGSTNWIIETIAGEEMTDEIEGVLVSYQATGVLWPNDDPQDGDKPVLRTFNPSSPHAVAELVGNEEDIPKAMQKELARCKISDGVYDWNQLSYNAWGSGANGTGKRCKEQRMLFILRKNDVYPVLVTCQPGSLSAMTKFFKQLTPTLRKPYWHAVVSLKLTCEKSAGKGVKFSRIKPTLSGCIPAETAKEVYNNFTKPLERISKTITPDAGSESAPSQSGAAPY